MATTTSIPTARTTTTTDRTRGALLLVAYAGTVVATAGLSLLAAVALNAALSPPVAGALALWMAGIAGVAAAPAAGRHAVATLDDRLTSMDDEAIPAADAVSAPVPTTE